MPPPARPADDIAPPLQAGMVYTREKLRKLFGIKDATINNGVFPFADRHEVWLFITEAKSAGRVPYQDKLTGDELHWQGQALGRTDPLVISHQADGNDLLVFYRRKTGEFPGSRFLLEGRFDYVSHAGSNRPETADPSWRRTVNPAGNAR